MREFVCCLFVSLFVILFVCFRLSVLLGAASVGWDLPSLFLCVCLLFRFPSSVKLTTHDHNVHSAVIVFCLLMTLRTNRVSFAGWRAQVGLTLTALGKLQLELAFLSTHCGFEALLPTVAKLIVSVVARPLLTRVKQHPC